MNITHIDATFNELNTVSQSGIRQAKRVIDILKLMKIAVHEHNITIQDEAALANYQAFLGEDGLQTAAVIQAQFEIMLAAFVENGIITEEELESFVNK